MAKNKPFKLDDYGMSGDDLDMPDWDFDGPKIKDDRSPATKIKNAAFRGAKETVQSPAFIRTLIRNSMPTGYGQAADLTDQSLGTLKNLYNDTAREIKPVLKDLKRVTKKIMPAAEAVLPKSIAARVKAWTESATDTNSYQSLSAASQQDAALQMQLGEIFKLQTTASMQRDVETDAKDNIKEGLTHIRHRDQIGQLDAMRVSLQQLAGYQSKIESGFQRKSLELQFRHYFVAMDSLAEQKRNNAATSAHLEGIVKNTGLPEFVKLHKSERFQEVLRNRLIDGMFSKRGGFIRNIGESLAKRSKEKALEFARQVQDGLGMSEAMVDGATMVQDMGMGESNAELAGGIGGGFAADLSSGLLGKYLKSKTEKHPWLAKTGRKLAYGVENASQLLTDRAHQDGGFVLKGGRVGSLRDRFAGIVNAIGEFTGISGAVRDSVLATSGIDTKLTTDHLGNMQHPDVFGRQTNKSITEIIPGYLSRIYRELQITRTGDESTKLMAYDFTTNKFADHATHARNIFKSVVSDSARENAKYQLDSLIDEIDPEKKLSPEQRKQLGHQMLRDRLKNFSGDQDRLQNLQSYTGKAAAHAQTYSDIYKNYFKGDDGSKQIKFAKRFNGLDYAVNDTRSIIQDHVNTGNREHLETMGILHPDNDTIDLNKLTEYLYKDADGNPGVKSSPRRVLNRRNLKTPTKTYARREFHTQHSNTPAPEPTVQNHPSVLLSEHFFEGLNNKLIVAINAIRGGNGDNASSTVGQKNNTFHDVTGLWGQGKHEAYKAWTSSSAAASDLFKKGVVKYQNFNIDKFKDQSLSQLKELHDVYVQGETAPRLLEWKLKAGHYKDQLTGKVIKAYSDIKGTIIDEFDKAVLTTEDIHSSFVQWGGTKRLLTTLGSVVEKTRDALHNSKFLLGVKAQGLAAAHQASTATENMFKKVKVKYQQIPEFEKTYAGTQGFGGNEALLQAIKDASPKSISEIMSETLLRIEQKLKEGISTNGTGADGGTTVPGKHWWQHSIGETAASLVGLGGKALGVLPSIARTVSEGFNKTFGFGVTKGSTVAKSAFSLLKGLNEGFKDIYVVGDEVPRLLARKMRLGHYRDAVTNDVIHKYKDIKGAVNDETGNEVMSAKEAETAFTKSPTGQLLLSVLGSTVRATKTIYDKISEGLPIVYKTAWWLAKKAYGLTDLPQDVFVKGRPYAVLMAATMRSGGYTSGVTGKVITKVSEIDGPVLALIKGQLETVLTSEEFASGLFNSKGELIKTGFDKLAGYATKSLNFGLSTAWKVAKHLKDRVAAGSDMVVKAGAKILRFAGDTLTHGVSSWGTGKNKWGESGNGGGTDQTKTVSWLSKIYTLLQASLTPRKKHVVGGEDSAGFRVGSYKDLMQSKGFLGGIPKGASDTIRAASTPAAGFFDKAKVKYKSLQEMELGGVKSIWNKIRGKSAFNDFTDDPNKTLVEIRDLLNDRLPAGGAAGALGELAGGGGMLGQAKRLVTGGWKTLLKPGMLSNVGKAAKGGVIAAGLGYAADAGLGALGVGKNNINEKQDDVNWERSSFIEKLESSEARAFEKLGGLFGQSSLVNSAKAERIKRETEYFKKKDKTEKTTFKKDTEKSPALDLNGAPVPTKSMWQSIASSDTVKSVVSGASSAATYIKDGLSAATSSVATGLSKTGSAIAGAFGFTGGAEVTQPGNGTGGDINKIPTPTGNRSWSGLKDTIESAAKMVGVDSKLMATMAAIESGFNYTVKAGTSSASGLYQFISSTWQSMLKKFGPKYGISPDTPATDPRANALMGAEYVKENTKALQSAVNRPLTDTDLYLAHFLGAGGARTFLKADPNAIGATLLPEAARANQGIFYDHGRALSVSEIYALVNNRVRSKGREFGITSGSSASPDTTKLGGDVKTAEGISVSGVGTSTDVAGKSATIPVSNQLPGASQLSSTATSQKSSSDAGVLAMGSGFTTPLSRDLSAQTEFKKDLSSEALGTVNATLSASLGIQQSQLETLQSILRVLGVKGGGGVGSLGNVESSVVGNTGAAGMANKTARPMSPAPVSMAKPTGW